MKYIIGFDTLSEKNKGGYKLTERKLSYSIKEVN